MRIYALSLAVILTQFTASAAGAADTQPACHTGAARQAVTVALNAPDAQNVVAVRVSLGYDPAVLRLPESGSGVAVRTRLKTPVAGASVMPNNEGDTLRMVVTKPSGLPLGPLVQVSFDRCERAVAPSADGVHCVVDGCASVGGPLDGCSCSVTIP